MTKVLVHLSDLHFRTNWPEELGVVLEAFFADLTRQAALLNDSDVYVVLSGDVVQAGGDPALYDAFLREFDEKLDAIGIPKSRRICVPGNHDVSADFVKSNLVEHEGVVSQQLREREFNSYVANADNILFKKFSNFTSFVPRFAAISLEGSSITGAGWSIDDDIGVYCLNTALCSSGGVIDQSGRVLPDERRLAVDTRNLQAWNLSCKNKHKILVMHHPVDWLIQWADDELKAILRKDFCLCLSGHEHKGAMYHSINRDSTLVECSAPPLFTNKTDELGYAMISIGSGEGVLEIAYRQWTKHRSFLPGVNFSNTENGRNQIREANKSVISVVSVGKAQVDYVDRHLQDKLNDALHSFSSQPLVWVNPLLMRTDELRVRHDSDESESPIDLVSLVSSPKSTIIKAPPQYGLTSLARHLSLMAWRNEESSLWLYLDLKGVKPYQVKSLLDKELSSLDCKFSDIKCVLVDSWTDIEKNSLKCLQKICELCPSLPIIVMQTIDYVRFPDRSDVVQIDREFDVLYLWALPREQVRGIIAQCNEKKHVGDEDSIVTKVVSDLEVLNLPRTPLNCLTLLKVSEAYFDESPVNRTELIKRVLFLLFNVDDIPTYKVKPDLTDCEYVLGRFCEIMLRDERYSFTREYFLQVLKQFCAERYIDLEVQLVFDVLHTNAIIVEHGNSFTFRFSYWIHYFAAQRMHQEREFANFIYEDMRYASFPEIIEFYTGIDRRREDALQVLTKDIKAIRELVEQRVGLPEEFDPYRLAQWKASQPVLEQMQNEIREGVRESRLPDSVKDRYADRSYDRTKPYSQDIRGIMVEYSVLLLLQAVKAGARALRNSDYADPGTRRELLQLITLGWEQLSRVLLVLSPVLAEKRIAAIDGLRVALRGEFGNSLSERLSAILQEIPVNVVSWYKEDLYSRKMGPLLIGQAALEKNDFRRHLVMLVLINQRPRGWKSEIEKYIGSLAKNSFYLLDTYRSLRTQYRYSFASASMLREIEHLIKMAAAKHATGAVMPGQKQIKRISNRVLPSRDVQT